MASAAKLHILPSLALKLQSYNKNEFRSGSCSGSQTGGTRPRRAEQESRPGGRLHIHREHPARLQGHPAGREQQREAGRRVLPPPGGTARCRGRGRCGVAAVREGRAGARGTRSSGCERAGAFCRPSFVARARLAPCPLGEPHGEVAAPRHRPRKREELLRAGCWRGRRLGRGPDRHYSYGRAGPAPPRPCGVPAPPEPGRATRQPRGDGPCAPEMLRRRTPILLASLPQEDAGAGDGKHKGAARPLPRPGGPGLARASQE